MSVPRRDLTRQVMCGSVAIGGGAPVTVQSMTTTKTEDAPATLAQIDRIQQRLGNPQSLTVSPFLNGCLHVRHPLQIVYT